MSTVIEATAPPVVHGEQRRSWAAVFALARFEAREHRARIIRELDVESVAAELTRDGLGDFRVILNDHHLHARGGVHRDPQRLAEGGRKYNRASLFVQPAIAVALSASTASLSRRRRTEAGIGLTNTSSAPASRHAPRTSSSSAPLSTAQYTLVP